MQGRSSRQGEGWIQEKMTLAAVGLVLSFSRRGETMKHLSRDVIIDSEKEEEN